VLLTALLASCAHPRLDDPPLDVTLVVTGLRQDERTLLRDQVCSVDGATQCQLVDDAPPAGKKRRKGDAPPPPSREAKIRLTYQGSLGELRYKIKALPHPGLEAQIAQVTLGYRGFDNLAPTINVEGPKDGLQIADKRVGVVVVVPDPDVAQVIIAGNEALPQSGGRYAADADLQEGDNPIAIKATDSAGNVRESILHVVVDTTPPALEVQVDVLAYDKAVVTGRVKDAAKVTIDGREVEIDLFGGFKRDISVDPDKAMVDVIAVDALGNQRKIRRSVKIPSAMSDITK
jgi:hypothetical protein